MIEFMTQIDIARPPEEVFGFVVDFENTPKWNYFVVDVENRSAGRLAIGTLFHQVRKTDEQDYEITALEPGRSVEIRTMNRSSPSFRIRYTVEPVGSGTRLSDHWWLETGHNTLLERLGGGRIRSSVTENLGKLKELLETGATELQDGRTSRLDAYPSPRPGTK